MLDELPSAATSFPLVTKEGVYHNEIPVLDDLVKGLSKAGYMQCLAYSQISMCSRAEFKYSLLPFLHWETIIFILNVPVVSGATHKFHIYKYVGRRLKTMFVISTLTKVLTHIDPENGKAQLAQVLSAMFALRRGNWTQVSVENV